MYMKYVKFIFIYSLFIQHVLYSYYLWGTEETKWMIYAPISQSVLIFVRDTEKLADICNADLIQSWRIFFQMCLHIAL